MLIVPTASEALWKAAQDSLASSPSQIWLPTLSNPMSSLAELIAPFTRLQGGIYKSALSTLIYSEWASNTRNQKHMTMSFETTSPLNIHLQSSSSHAICTSYWKVCRLHTNQPEYQRPWLWRRHSRIRLQSADNHMPQRHEAAEVLEADSVNIDVTEIYSSRLESNVRH